eukprot:TRINITY_DN4156_c0_g1_i2.p1 TRINITY_DN4156_c0_g1~~TRINITY_DN4156_c0_g1_i2.p1  ORF type:complete len:229 (-),score=43.03 TRINITY_DN4156_c0_g1_i2:67-657(-)
MADKTAEDFTKGKDGKTWFHTGDVGQWNENDGTLSIIGRVKDIFKLDTGEYVSPDRLETIYGRSSFIGNIFVYGESHRSHLIGIVVPDPLKALAWAKENGVDVPDKDSVSPPHCPASLCQNEDLKLAIVKDLMSVASDNKLNRFELIQNIALDGTFWLPEGGLVTSAFKNKRPVLAEHYKEQLDETYDAGFLIKRK